MPSNFNDTTPAAPGGNVNVKWQTDGAGNDSAYVPTVSPFGGTNVQTTNYTILSGDAGKNVVANDASAIQFLLPSSPPSATFSVFIENIGAGTLTLNPNGKTLDGSGSNLSITTNSGVYVSTDGTNYFTERGMGGGGGFANPMTTLGDIITGGSSGTPTRLGIGSTGNVLTVSAGAPAWSAPSGGGTAFQNTQRLTTVSADGFTTTLQQVGDNIHLTDIGTPAAQPATATTCAAIEYPPAGGPGQLAVISNTSNYVTGRHLKLLFDMYITTTGDDFTWIMLTELPGNILTYGRSLTPAASSGTNYVGFRCNNRSGSSTETTWQAACGDGVSDTATSTGVTQDTSAHRFVIVMDDATPQVLYYIDGSLVATNTTTIPAAGKQLLFYLSEWFNTTPPNVGWGQLLVASDL